MTEQNKDAAGAYPPHVEAMAQAIGSVLITRGSTYEAASAALLALDQAGYVVLTDEELAQRVAAPLQRLSALAGRLLDESGDPHPVTHRDKTARPTGSSAPQDPQ